MRTRNIIAALLLMVAGMQTTWAQKIILHMQNKQKVEYEISQLDSITFVEGEQIYDETHGVYNGHEWVDLGLPSGTLWATCNVGAKTPEEPGDYFAWGEILPKKTYNWSSYKWMSAGKPDWNLVNKYTRADGQMDGCWYNSEGYFVGDGLTELLPADDAATANWGSGWQMPDLDQSKELIDSKYTTMEWSETACKITSKTNGNSIVLPTVGIYEDEELRSNDYYITFWLRTTYITNFAHDLYINFRSGYYGTSSDQRYYGQIVRPVRKK